MMLLAREEGWQSRQLVLPEEGPDPFRIKRVVLRRPNAEACWSCHSVKVGELVTPNRDYAAEGFSAILGGTQYKILDAYAFGLLDAERNHVSLSAKSVAVSPWSATYSYHFGEQGEGGGGELNVTYLLPSHAEAMLCTVFSLDKASGSGSAFRIVVRPMVVLGFPANSGPDSKVSCRVDESRRLVCASSKAEVHFHSEEAASCAPLSAVQDWHYKLGWGERAVAGGEIVAKGVFGRSQVAGQLELVPRNGKCVLYAQAVLPGMKVSHPPAFYSSASSYEASYQSSCRKSKPVLELARKYWGNEQATRLATRLYVLENNFNFEIEGIRAYDAGSMWFRQAWLRDAFETLNSSFQSFVQADAKRVRELLAWAFRLQNSSGLLPTAVGPDGTLAYNGLDPTLLGFLCAARYLEHKQDDELRHLLSSAVSSFLKSASNQGNPVRLGSGLLSCPADYSWIDSKVSVQVGGEAIMVPNRIPRAWLEGCSSSQAREICTASYFLVETNAQWISFLQKAAGLDLPAVNANWLATLAKRSFRETFMRGEVLADIIPAAESSRTDSLPAFSSTTIVAYSLLAGYFSKRELALAYLHASRHFVHSGTSLFGLPVQAGQGHDEPFLGDAQYHGNVCWPRDNPYLFHLLMVTGHEDEAEQLLLSALAHQSSESTIGYSSELFALDAGTNPLPVKNPAQLWSQYCDPFADYLFWRECSQEGEAQARLPGKRPDRCPRKPLHESMVRF